MDWHTFDTTAFHVIEDLTLVLPPIAAVVPFVTVNDVYSFITATIPSPLRQVNIILDVDFGDFIALDEAIRAVAWRRIGEAARHDHASPTFTLTIGGSIGGIDSSLWNTEHRELVLRALRETGCYSKCSRLF